MGIDRLQVMYGRMARAWRRLPSVEQRRALALSWWRWALAHSLVAGYLATDCPLIYGEIEYADRQVRQ